MHEVSLAQRILEISLEAARGHGGGRVASARVLVGELSCVEPETLRFAFEIAARGTAADGCRLEMVRVAARLKCYACGDEHAGELLDPCPACGSPGGEVLAGRELRVESVEVDTAEAGA